jgi:hypothetical protein
MTQTVANTNVSNTFDYWRNRTNEVAYAMSNYAVTVNGGTPNGNASVNGAFAFGVSAVSQLWSSNTQTSGTSTQIIDAFPLGQYRTAEYIISVTDNNANSHYTSKALVTHDGASAYISEYAVMQSNNSTVIGLFSASVVSGNVNLSFTPVSSNTTVNFNRILVSV